MSVRDLKTKPGIVPRIPNLSDKPALQNSGTPSLRSTGFEDEDEDENEVSLFPNREDQRRIVPVPLITKAKCQRFRGARFVELA